ncbi:MAG TPA: hypothetical protein QGH10_09440, partial [Armatimonadota bacterium]|nr:hypothetical protein [Armatimonadota bacterium]
MIRPTRAHDVLRLAVALCALSLPWAAWCDEFPSADHGRYLSKVADAGEFVPVEPAAAVETKGVRLTVGGAGRIQIGTGAGAYTIDSCFTYPGAAGETGSAIGWNGLPSGFSQDNYPDVESQLGPEDAWLPRARRTSPDTITVEAEGSCYRLLRTVTVEGGRLDVTDEFTNLRDVPTAVVPRYRITSPSDYLARFSPNLEVAANPIVFLRGPEGGLGVVMQDNLSRLRMRPWIPESGNRAGFQINRV